MLLDTTKYDFEYYHAATCILCGKELMQGHITTKEVRSYIVPPGLKKTILEHLGKHMVNFYMWDYESDEKLRKMRVYDLDKVIERCYEVEIGSEKAYKKCKRDLEMILDDVKAGKSKPITQEGVSELKKTVTNLPFASEEKSNLKEIIDEIDDLSTQIFRDIRSKEIIESSQSVYYTGRGGIPGLGKRH